jgi:hypothetical protein
VAWPMFLGGCSPTECTWRCWAVLAGLWRRGKAALSRKLPFARQGFGLAVSVAGHAAALPVVVRVIDPEHIRDAACLPSPAATRR